MKNISILILFWLNLYVALAQSPALINYQAVVRDANGNLITSGTISLGISIHDAIVGGNQLYFETHNGITPNAFGVVNVLIGGGTVLSGNFLLINWGNGNKYLQVYVNSNPIGSRTQMVSVPYALYANKASKADSANFATNANNALTANSLVNPPVVNTGWTDYLLVVEQRANNAGNPVGNGGFVKRAINTPLGQAGNAINFDPTANTITLNQAGTYYVRGSAPAWQSDEHQLIIRDVATNNILITGTSEHSVDNGNSPEPTHSFVEGFIIVNPNSSIVFKLDHWVNVISDLGRHASTSSPLNTILSKCFVQKIQ